MKIISETANHFLIYSPELLSSPMFVIDWWESFCNDKAFWYTFYGTVGNPQELIASNPNPIFSFSKHTNYMSAFALLYPFFNSFLFTYYIYPKYRKDISELYNGLISGIKLIWGRVTMVGVIWTRHKVSISIAKRFGWKEVGIIPSVFGPSLDGIIFVKEVE